METNGFHHSEKEKGKLIKNYLNKKEKKFYSNYNAIQMIEICCISVERNKNNKNNGHVKEKEIYFKQMIPIIILTEYERLFFIL